MTSNLILKIRMEFSGIEFVDVLPYARPEGIINSIWPSSST